MKVAIQLFKFFASLKLAIFLLLALAAAFAVGTFVESAYGADAAKVIVYESRWLDLLLIALALNVAAAAVERLPWRKKHMGFVATHAGIILLLAGSLVTRALGREGQMAIQEGGTEGRMVSKEPVLQVVSENLGFSASSSFPVRAFPWKGYKALQMAAHPPTEVPKISLTRYYPKSREKGRVRESSEGPAAAEVALKSSFMETSHWLMLDDPEKGEILLGPAKLRFTTEPFPTPHQATREEFLEFHFEGSVIKIPIPREVPKTLSLKGTPYRLTVLRILKDAVVDQGRLQDRSGEWKNPACELILEGAGLKESHTVFSKFPNFPSLHGRRPSELKVKIFYRRPNAPEESAGNELRLVWQDARPLLYQVRKGKEILQGEVEIGKEYPTGWMDFRFRIERYYPHAEADSEFLEEPVSSQAQGHVSSAEIEMEWKGEKKSFWLGEGDSQKVRLAGDEFQILYGLRTVPVGFRLQLRDFRVEHYPGTNRPASFESDVTLKDDLSGIRRDLTIGMNRPLTHRGFKVFQSGYQQPPGEPEVSIFTVAKDPGIPIKYGGAAVLIGGILTMFYTRRFSSRESYSEKPAVTEKHCAQAI